MESVSLHGKALAWAESHLGDAEVPPGSNTGPFVYSCQRATWLGGTRWPWCFTAETLVDTPAGAVRIDTLELGDWVLSHTGTPRRVLAVMGRLPERCIRVKAQGLDSVTTPEHPYLVRRSGRDDWIPVGELVPSDRICLRPFVPNTVSECDPEIAYVLGRYTADGWFTQTRRVNASTMRERAYLCGAKDERDEILEAVDGAGISVYATERRTVTQMEILGGDGVTALFKRCGSSAATKRVPTEAFGWPPESRQRFLDGYADGDGSPYRDGVRAATISRELAYSITRLARSLGYVTSLTERQRDPSAVIEGRLVAQTERIYHVAWASPSAQSGMRFDGQDAWAKVKSITEVAPQPVYNLTIEDEHTFVADGAAVHNCVAFFQKAWQTTGFRMPWLGAGAYAFLDWAKTVGWATNWQGAVPGDGVILNIGAGHMAMLSASVRGHDVPTISGNYGDKVTEHTFDLKDVRGFIHIPADKTVVLPKPAKPPVYEVVTSASGKRKVVYVSGANAISRKLGKLLNRYGGLTIKKKTV